jgi:hypothetical protein
MIHGATADFWSDYRALPANIRVRADKQFASLKNNPQHPSLQFKKLGDRNGQEIWSARVTLKTASWLSSWPTSTCGSGLASITSMTL